MQDSNNISNISVTLVYQSKQPLWWSPVHRMDHPAVCDMMRGPPSILLDISHQWKAVICSTPTAQYTVYICNLSMSVKAAPLMISGALDEPSSRLWYDEGTTKLLGQYLTSMESCDVQDSNSTSYICVTSVCQSKQLLQWSPVHWMNHLAVCDLQDSNSTSYICATSVYQSQWPLQWALVHWVDNLAVCDMIRGPPSFLFSIAHQWKAVMCRTLTVHHIYV